MRITSHQPGPVLAAATERLLARLPGWFGIPEANRRYVEAAGRLPGWLAAAHDEPCGVVLLDRRFDRAGEVHLIAVDPDRHGQGVGTGLLDGVETAMRDEGRSLLTVKTLGPG